MKIIYTYAMLLIRDHRPYDNIKDPDQCPMVLDKVFLLFVCLLFLFVVFGHGGAWGTGDVVVFSSSEPKGQDELL